MTPQEAADKILPNAELLKMNGGGITFSGGEALSQPEFVLETRRLLHELHACIETSGYAPSQIYQRVAAEMNLVIQDIKIMEPVQHRRWTGADNARILENVRWLCQSGIPFRIRVPLIPGVNDTLENMQAIAELIAGADDLEKVELLRYNRAAGAKYAGVGLTYAPDFCVDQQVKEYTGPFEEAGIKCDIL